MPYRKGASKIRLDFFGGLVDRGLGFSLKIFLTKDQSSLLYM